MGNLSFYIHNIYMYSYFEWIRPKPKKMCNFKKIYKWLTGKITLRLYPHIPNQWKRHIKALRVRLPFFVSSGEPMAALCGVAAVTAGSEQAPLQLQDCLKESGFDFLHRKKICANKN